jgi:membrane protease subunit (stomatin/prohibitin family)
MPQVAPQTLFFRGIYEYNDPSGSILCARVPFEGLADLYHGTAVIVRPSQGVLVVHQGLMTDFFGPGTHSLSTENLPVLTKLKNVTFGFQSPVRTELYFFSANLFTARRWGTSQPAVAQLDGRSIPVRAFGQYNIKIYEPKKFFLKIMGSRTTFGVNDIEEFVQGCLIQNLPVALKGVAHLADLSAKQPLIAQQLNELVTIQLKEYGLSIENLQVMSILPSKEILAAMDASAAMQVIGDNREFLLYKAAATLDSLQSGSSTGGGKGDPMHMMMGLMLGKNLLANNDPRSQREKVPLAIGQTKNCANCNTANAFGNKFCPKCGKELL